MSAHEAIYSRLSNYSALTALVSTRIYRLVMPQGTSYPCVTFSLVTDSPHHAMGSDAGVKNPRFQVDVWATTTASLDSVATQIKAAIQDYSGTVESVVIQRIYLEDETDIVDADEKGQMVYHRALDFTVWHEV